MSKVTRPAAEKRKIRYNNDFELCYMRHRYLRKADYNPTQIDMEPYMGIVRSVSKKTVKKYQNLFKSVGLELDDIVNIGRIHVTSFLGLFSLEKLDRKYRDFVGMSIKANERPPTENEVMDKNKANFTLFLHQRMDDLIRICVQKTRNIKGIQTNEFLILFGPNKPIENLRYLSENHVELGFKKLDNVTFKAIKRREKVRGNGPFNFAGSWYIAIKLDHRPLCVADLAGAGYDPHDNIHNSDPEALLLAKEQNNAFAVYMKNFMSSTKEEKAKVFASFIEANRNNPKFAKEVEIAKRLYKDLKV